MAFIDPASLILVLSIEWRHKNFPRTIQPMLKHLSKTRGMHLPQDSCVSPSLWIQLRWSPVASAQISSWQVKTVSIFGHGHHSEPHGTLCSVNGRDEEGGSSGYNEEDQRPWAQWLAPWTMVTNIWVLQHGQGRQGGLLGWTGPLIRLFPVKPFQEHHGLLLVPEMWGDKAHLVPVQSFLNPHAAHNSWN